MKLKIYKIKISITLLNNSHIIIITTLSLIKFKSLSYDRYKPKERKRKNAFKRFEAKLEKNASGSYRRINITAARWSKNIVE